MSTEYRRAIADVFARIATAVIVDGESPEKLRQATADRVADLGKPSASADAQTWAQTWAQPVGMLPPPGPRYRPVGTGDGSTYVVG